MDVRRPLRLEPKELHVGLLGGLGRHVFGHEKSWCCVVDPAEALPSASLEYPVVGVESR
jgi:hypothetical protein